MLSEKRDEPTALALLCMLGGLPLLKPRYLALNCATCCVKTSITSHMISLYLNNSTDLQHKLVQNKSARQLRKFLRLNLYFVRPGAICRIILVQKQFYWQFNSVSSQSICILLLVHLQNNSSRAESVFKS